MKINDWSAIQSLFDELNKRLDKARKVADGVGVPKLYVRMICELEDFLTGEEEGGLGCQGCVESASSQCIPVIACGPLRRQQPMCDIPKCVCVWGGGVCLVLGLLYVGGYRGGSALPAPVVVSIKIGGGGVVAAGEHGGAVILFLLILLTFSPHVPPLHTFRLSSSSPSSPTPLCPPAETLANRDLKKKMSPTNAKALNTMRQRIKKHNSTDEYGQLVLKYRCGGGGDSNTSI